MRLRFFLAMLLATFVIYLSFELVRRISGGSLGFEELAIALLIANLGYSFHISSKLSGHIGWHKGKDQH
ncbi:hypothetical protein HYX10_05560 [Candidatus Woesearchaeota archaeon]|nr:hypothetical protein [Candidatus Woesearchaeota archaeon]